MNASPAHDIPTLRLRRGEQRRLLAGHLWVFSNEIDTRATPLKGLEPGADVRLEASDGRFLAYAYANPASLITARVTGRAAPLDERALGERIARALALRERRFDAPFYRWVHGEGDLLPGLVVDRYGAALVVQITTAGMERRREAIVEALVALSGASRVALAADAPVRALEGLPSYREQALGDTAAPLEVREHGLRFTLPVDGGQKTGWFHDQRDARLAARAWAGGARVLDLYCYLGAFGLNAAAAGAREVLAIDASARAVERANAAARENALDGVFAAREGEAVETMRELADAGERFDLVVLDPPAFVRKKRDREAGLRHYALNNRLAMRLLAPGGVLLSASCSQSVDQGRLEDILRRAAPKGAAAVQLLGSVVQPPDHPVHAAMPETRYLSGSFARLIR